MNDTQLTALLNKMTLEEKIGQLVQLATPFFKGATNEGQITGPLAKMGFTDEEIRNSGSVLGTSGAKEAINIQKAYLEENRLGIPLLLMADIIHGYKTIFPVPLAIGCSWDPQLAEKSAAIAAKEAAVAGVHVTFAPMVDLVRDPRWGRVMESTGEDPFLNSVFARAFVRGFQGDDLSNDYSKVAACVKHFAAYGASEAGRDYNTVDMSERQLREYYLPGYKAALDEGCEMVMTAFNTVEGVPATGNKKLMRDLLRDEWNFDGILISDWGAVKEMIPHGVAEDAKEAAKKALIAGVDIEMMSECYSKHLKELVEENMINEELIDEAVLRILKLKQKLGLFENPYRGADIERENEIVFSKEHRQVSRELATKSCVLLKNDSILPLQKQQKIALIGPFAESGDILGPWSWLGSKDDAITVVDGMKQKIESNQLLVSRGCDIQSSSESLLNEALEIARGCDVIVLALGEESDMSGEAGSRSNIKLPQPQLDLISRMKQVGKPMVVVLFNGRPLDLDGVIDNVDAVLEAWFPGSEGGAAIADLLYGDANPSGKLVMSFPQNVGQVPVYYNHFNTGRPHYVEDADPRYTSKYLDIPNDPLFPFGYGLSYTTFEYGEITLSSKKMTIDEPLTITVKVKNTGAVKGDEVIQLYVRDIAGDVVRPMKELKDFKKITLQPGEEQVVEFTLREEQLRYHHHDLSFSSDPGSFIVFVGPDSKNAKGLPFTLVK